MNRFHIEPIWNIEEFYDLNYVVAPFHDDYKIDEYVDAGHRRESLDIQKYLEPKDRKSVV